MPVVGLTSSEQIAPRLLDHYRQYARALPWRSPPGMPLPDPYRVWLSEIMLQQTMVVAVIPYFEAFVARWPDVAALAAAADADVMAAWAGLGYYARARNLLACARQVAGELGGQFPQAEADLLSLPGVGPYTAAAIAAIAFGQRAIVVDGNVERVVSRLFAVEAPLPGAKAQLHAFTGRITPDNHAGDFAQAMMDLGATICTPRSPDCPACPLSEMCQAGAGDDPARFPLRMPKKPKPQRTGIAWWVEAEGQVWLVQRPAKGLLGGMRALPSSDWREGGLQYPPPLNGDWQHIAEPVRHVFTHFALDLSVHWLELRRAPASAAIAKALGAGQWWPVAQLNEAGLPTLFARAAGAVRAARPGEDEPK